ncbi:Pvc16 family protein [Moorena sp. SIO3H5]|uniref:Pvc16 family protein n=1 Tax=Moorena sp. SIO3H5 TaxID=2607834 RepID=UPI0013BBBB0E|nr:Pvc16 family protein [Moorena sp. SIO3H5]NEO72502.1 DUF4255 domain-containing protein [Moorena sp. SIO3H5]
MIRDLSQVLRRILEDTRLSSRFPELAEAQISFERPSETFSPGQTTVNLFLYDIRENLELRSNEPTIEMRDGQAIIHNPPKRIACSYLVTAWPIGGEELPLQEHRLLSQVLQLFSAYPTIPDIPFLENTRLAGQDLPLPMVTAQVERVQSASEFWTALGNQLRPSITVTVTIAIKELFEPEPTPIVITQDWQLGQRISPSSPPQLVPSTQQGFLGQRISPSSPQLLPGNEQRFFRIGGRVTDADNKPVVGATVVLVERNLRAATDRDGNYSIGAIPAGAYTLRVQLDDGVQEANITIPVETAASNYNLELQQ